MHGNLKKVYKCISEKGSCAFYSYYCLVLTISFIFSELCLLIFSYVIFVSKFLYNCLRWAASSQLSSSTLNINLLCENGLVLLTWWLLAIRRPQKLTQISSILVKKKKSSYFVYICFSGELHRLCKLTVLTGRKHLPSPVTCWVNCGWWLQKTN